jgi:hypothetical protein
MITINETEKRKLDNSNVCDYLIKAIKIDMNISSMAIELVTVECISGFAAKRVNDMFKFMLSTRGWDGIPHVDFKGIIPKDQKDRVILTGTDLNIAVDFLCQTEYLSDETKNKIKKTVTTEPTVDNKQISGIKI